MAQAPYVWYQPPDSIYRVMDVPESNGRMIEFMDGFGDRNVVFVPNGTAAGSGNPPWQWYQPGFNKNPRVMDIPDSAGRVMEFHDSQRGLTYVFVPEAGSSTGGGGGETTPASPRQAFYFAMIDPIDLPIGWTPLTVSGGGMTGAGNVATAGVNGLTLTVESVIQVRVWAEFAGSGTGEQYIGVQIDESDASRIRGQVPLPPGINMLQTAYDGWVSPNVVISPAGMNAAASADPLAPPGAVARLMPTSYVTIIITPTGN